MTFYHPKYYKELRRAGVQVNSSRPAHSRCNKSDQAISDAEATAASERATGPGLKQQAASDSQVVNQVKLSSQSQASSSKRVKHQAASVKPQATSIKLQATSVKLQDS